MKDYRKESGLTSRWGAYHYFFILLNKAKGNNEWLHSTPNHRCFELQHTALSECTHWNIHHVYCLILMVLDSQESSNILLKHHYLIMNALAHSHASLFFTGKSLRSNLSIRAILLRPAWSINLHDIVVVSRYMAKHAI